MVVCAKRKLKTKNTQKTALKHEPMDGKIHVKKAVPHFR
jgi:hypothetical protein